MSNFGSRAHAPSSTLGLLGSVLASACFLACGGRSELDDYADGVPSIVPQSNASGGGNHGGDGDGNHGDGDGDGDGDTGMTPAGAEVGEACELDSDCMGGANASCLQTLQVSVLGIFTIDVDFPGGSCTVRNCTGDKDCPTGTGCLSGFSEPACTRLCTDNSQCRADEGYTCGTVMGTNDTRKFCQPPIDLSGLPGGGNLPF